MLELGQTAHAFDWEAVPAENGDNRTAFRGTGRQSHCFDGKSYSLDPNDIVDRR